MVSQSVPLHRLTPRLKSVWSISAGDLPWASTDVRLNSCGRFCIGSHLHTGNGSSRNHYFAFSRTDSILWLSRLFGNMFRLENLLSDPVLLDILTCTEKVPTQSLLLVSLRRDGEFMRNWNRAWYTTREGYYLLTGKWNTYTPNSSIWNPFGTRKYLKK